MTPSRSSGSDVLLAQAHPRQPRGHAIRELFGWRIISCSDVRHSWVEIEAPKDRPLEMAPGTAQLIAEALASVATHAGDSAVLRFISEDRSERRGSR